jgi:mono/diheme cytochrome c family protein
MRRALTILGVVLVVIVVVLAVGVGVLFAQSNAKLARTYDVPAIAEIEIPTDTESLVEGERLYTVYGCGGCHTATGEGYVMIDDPALGRVVATNLTGGEGGVAGNYETSADWLRTLRHGVAEDGTSYVLMPSHHVNHFTDEDMGAIIAYIESLDPVDNVMPDIQLGPVGRALILAESTNDLLPGAIIDHDNVDVWSDVEKDANPEYGHYLVRNCVGCHGLNFSGASIPGEDIPASNLTFHETGIADYTLEDFGNAMRNGIRPDGSAIDTAMPWNLYGQLTDTEIEAMYLYFQSLEPLPYNSDVTAENSQLYR